MKVQDLRDALNATMVELKAVDEAPPGPQGQAPQQPNDDLLTAVKHLTEEVRLLREERKKDETEMRKVQQEMGELYRVVAQQQNFVESLDARDRQCNLVITGVPDEGEVLDGATTEKEKYDKVLSKMGVTNADLITDPVEMSRMGIASDGKNRPILVKMPSKAQREKILKKAKNLKEAGSAYKKVYVRKNVCLMLRHIKTYI